MKNKKLAVLSLSGGMDSSTLLLNLLRNGYEVLALSFDYGQKHNIELERAKELVEYINSIENSIVENGDKCPYYPVRHEIIKLDGLQNLLHSNLVQGGDDVPEGHYEQENMKQTVVPNRNKIFSSIIQAAALSLATSNGKQEVKIALGIHAGDFSVYPDCRKEFRDADFEAFKLGNWDADLVSFYTPYIHIMKYDILKDGQECCEYLGLSFDEVYKRTMTSYKPIYIEYPIGFTMEDMRNGPEGDWYSDYKSASSVERIEAFLKLGRPDPTPYADETGPISWETAKSHVEQVLQNA